jgi:hypothetical protein
MMTEARGGLSARAPAGARQPRPPEDNEALTLSGASFRTEWEQQAVLSLHRIRQQLVKIRTMQAHQVRGLLYEFGVVVPQGWRALLAQAGPIND